MDLTTIISLIGASLCVLLAAVAVALKRRSLPWLLFAFGMVLLGIESALGAFTLAALSGEEVIKGQRLLLIVGALLPGIWLAFSFCYSRGSYFEFVRKSWGVLALAGAAPILGLVTFRGDLVRKVVYSQVDLELFIGLGNGGRIVYFTQLVVSVLILLNFERTFRSAVGVMKWRIKYFVVGMVLLFGARLYVSSQVLLYSGLQGMLLQIQAVLTLGGCLLISYSLLRTRLAEAEIYPSNQVLQHSLTAVMAGVYLVCLAILANWLARVGGNSGLPLKALLLMVGVVVLTAAVLSDRLQQKARLFVIRNFRRPAHDYRKVWSAFTERTGLLIEPAELCRETVKSISETFDLLSVTLWLASEHDQALVFGASTSLVAEKAELVLAERSDVRSLLQTARNWRAPVDMDLCKESGIQLLKEINPDHFHQGGRRVCVPLVSGGELMGLLTVADRVNGLAFSPEDIDLLKCIGDHVAVRLRNLKLSQRFLESKEMEAFQTMSAFFVHDLKNTASTLSLMLQNLSSHFGDPNFREDCVRSLSRSVGRLKELIKRMAMLRHELELKKTEIDLNALVSSALQDLQNLQGYALNQDLQSVRKIHADTEQLQKVVTNLLLNAKEALNGHGEIRVRTFQENGWVTLSIADNGCGMTQEFIQRSLFRPFQTTKKSGLGIGMFQSKAIIEAHQGRIDVESKLGQGTTFRIMLPLTAR